jgi:hypothetical protein
MDLLIETRHSKILGGQHSFSFAGVILAASALLDGWVLNLMQHLFLVCNIKTQ